MNAYSGGYLMSPVAFDISEKNGILAGWGLIITIGLVLLALAFTDKGGKDK